MQASFRRDVSVGHDSCAVVLTSAAQAGCCLELEPGSPPWVAAVQQGQFLPIGLAGDRGGTCVRVLLETSLSPEEEAEWADSCSGRLIVADGRLMVCGSTDFLEENLFGESDMIQDLAVPSGTYQVDIYTCFVGINGPPLNTEARAAVGLEPVGAWFRRTRPGKRFPLWLRLHCYNDPAADPGEELRWQNSQREASDLDADESTSWADFIVRLTLREAASELTPLDEDGFVPVAVRPRMLQRCPLGLKARLSNQR